MPHTYQLKGSGILRESWKENSHTYELIPLYDNENSVCGIIYEDATYYFQKNLQGDVIALVDANAQVAARYTYDAWGKVTGVKTKDGAAITDTAHIAYVNPFRYRGYYLDRETGLYYLQSRYYDPVVGRFVNGDDPKIATSIFLIYFNNVYTYCYNNAINNSDSTGYITWPGEIHRYVQSIMAMYIWLFLGCFTYMEYFVKLGKFRYGLADLYAKEWNEIWEIKPDKTKYYSSGPIQLQKYLDGIDGSKVGRNLGTFTSYYYSDGIYKVTIRSDSNDGMIYYSYEYCWQESLVMLLAVTSVVLICTGVGSGVGAAGLGVAGQLGVAGGLVLI